MINEIKILDLDLKLNIVRLKLGLLKLLADHIIIVQKKKLQNIKIKMGSPFIVPQKRRFTNNVLVSERR